MMDRPRSDPGASSALGKLAGFVIAVVVLAGIYGGYQALQVLFPPNTYETATSCHRGGYGGRRRRSPLR